MTQSKRENCMSYLNADLNFQHLYACKYEGTRVDVNYAIHALTSMAWVLEPWVVVARE